MKQTLFAVAGVLAVSVAAYGLEFVEGVRHVDGLNLAERTGVPLDFRLSAVRNPDGDVNVQLKIPGSSSLAPVIYLRLEIIRDGHTLLASDLQAERSASGQVSAGFRLHESLADDAFVRVGCPAGLATDATAVSAYRIPVGDYIIPEP